MGVAKVIEQRRLKVFEDAYSMWSEKRLTQKLAAKLLDASARTFGRWIQPCGEERIEGLRDRRVSRASHRAVPVDEVMAMVSQYESDHDGSYAGHFLCCSPMSIQRPSRPHRVALIEL